MTFTQLWTQTPLLYSTHISSRLGISAYLKLENVHLSHSFKYRGISLFIQRCIETHGPDVHVVAASGGNAGLAVACAAKVLQVKCTIFIPKGISASTLAFLKSEGAEVMIEGDCYLHALQKAEEAVSVGEHIILVPAYDHPTVWEGHASMITEIASQLGCKPDAILCSIGGGGLLGGIIVGCEAQGWDDVPIIGLETLGSNCFYSSISLNSDWKDSKGVPEDIDITQDEMHGVKIAHLEKLPSRATSLGASWASPGVIRKALDRKGGLKCVCISDTMSMNTAALFAEEHKILVELACSTTLAPAYEPSLMSLLLPSDGAPKTVVLVVCGGFKISLAEMGEYRDIVRKELEDGEEFWKGTYNGEEWSIKKKQNMDG